MKISKYLALGLLAISLTPVWGQTTFTINNSQQPTFDATNLTRFNLDFSGGPPSLLVEQIQKATGKPLNVIIPNEYAQEDLPPLKMNNVNVVQLFQALAVADEKTITVPTRNGSSYGTYNTAFGFATKDEPITDNSIWYFLSNKPSLPPTNSTPKICKYYSLEIYLKSGFTVDDITTAIQTGWKMMGETSPPEISFHKETKLLIAVGEPDKLEVIDNVLEALQPQQPNPTADFEERLKQITKNMPQAPVPAARPPLSPENQVNLLEQNRRNSQQLPPAVLPPPPLKPEAGQ